MTELQVIRKGLDPIVDEFISGPDQRNDPNQSKGVDSSKGTSRISAWSIREICGLLIGNGVYLDLIRSNPRLLNNIDSRKYKVGLLVLRNCGISLSDFIHTVVNAHYPREVSPRPEEKRPVNVHGLIQSILKGEDPQRVRLQVLSDELYIRVRRERFILYGWRYAKEVEHGLRPNAIEYSKLRDYRWSVHGLDEIFESYPSGFGVRGKGLLSGQEHQ